MNKSIAILFVFAAFAIAVATATVGYSSYSYRGPSQYPDYLQSPYRVGYPQYSGYPYSYGPYPTPYGYRAGVSVSAGAVPAYPSYQPYYAASYYGPQYYPYASKA